MLHRIPASDGTFEIVDDDEVDDGGADAPPSLLNPAAPPLKAGPLGDGTAAGSTSSTASSSTTGGAVAGSETITHAGSGLVFNNAYGSGVSTTFRNEIVAAENYLQTQFTNSTTINVNFDLQSLNPAYSGENSFNPILVSYSTFVNALASHATSALQKAAVASLQHLSDPSHGAGFIIPVGEARILGLAGGPSGGTIDDSVVLNSVYWTSSALQSYPSDAEAVIEHEVTEGAMGRIGSLGIADSAWAPMDLFRFTASGQRDFTGGQDGQSTYFSADGTNVNTGLRYHSSVNTSGQFDGFDFADWDQVGQDAGARDPFGPGGPGAGDPGTLSATDLQIMNVLGWGSNGIAVSGTTSDAVQGGPPVTLLTAPAAISDPNSSTIASATVKITNGSGAAVAGDQLFVAGVQSGTVSGVTVAWNAATGTLTLTGSEPVATYQTLLSQVTYQDTGTDASSGAHPVRTITWSANDGTQTLSATSQVKVDRLPTVNNATGIDVVGSTLTVAAANGVLSGDSDLDGDALSVTAVNGGAGNVGASIAGSLGHLTLNANGSYTYAANSGITTGVDTFAYTVSDGNGGTANASLRITIEAPDLVIAGITPAASSVTQGSTFSYSYVVKNQGTAATTSPFWSAAFLDGQTPANVINGAWNQGAGSLGANGTQTFTNSFSTAGMSIGAHTLWLLADSYNDATGQFNSNGDDIAESNENNNWTSISFSVAAAAPAPMPDLVIASITPTTASVTQGSAFSYAYVVKNQGTEATTSSFWSAAFLDQQTPANVINGAWNQETGSLGANGTQTFTNSFSTAGMSVGTHTLWILADSYNNATGQFNSNGDNIAESNETNNWTSVTFSVTGPAPPPQPDLVIASITPTAASVTQGSTFGYSYVVANQGAGATTSPFWSAAFLDGQTPANVINGAWNQETGSLGANGTQTFTNSFSTAGISVGTHTLWLLADSFNDATGQFNSNGDDIAESSENNNWTSITFNVTAAGQAANQPPETSTLIFSQSPTISGDSGTQSTAPIVVPDGSLVELVFSAAPVSFIGATGTLQLDHSAQFSGQISGFAEQDQIDLRDIVFTPQTTSTYAANLGNTGGDLIVGDKGQAASLVLFGSYTASEFATSSDGHGGTLVTMQQAPPSAQTSLTPQTRS